VPKARSSVRALVGTTHGTHSTSSSGSGPREHDPFQAAALRLQNLLAGVGDGEDELLESLVAEETPEAKMQAHIAIGGIVTLVSVAICTLCGQDPWGGMGLNPETGAAALIGALAGIPMAAGRWWSWSPAGAATMPALEDMHLAQNQLVAPWMCRMAPWHVGLQMVLEVAPVTLLLLPAAQGGLLASLDMYTTALHGLAAAGVAVGDSHAAVAAGVGDGGQAVARAGCLALTAGVAALGKGLELDVSEHEYEVVAAAMDNADRYYRVMSVEAGPSAAAAASAASSSSASDGGSGTGSGGGAADSARAALAFRSVAQTWMDTRHEASIAAAATCFTDVMLLGGLWYAAGNLAAPLVAAFAINAVDYHKMHAAVLRREAKVASHSRRGGGNGSSGSNGQSSPRA